MAGIATAERHVLPAGTMPRGLSRVQAAAYVGVSPTTFDRMVSDGLMPRPVHIYSRRVWDVRKLDAAFCGTGHRSCYRRSLGEDGTVRDAMIRSLRHYRHIVEEKDRHGNVRHYFRAGHGQRIRIRERLGTEEFDKRYHELLSPGATAFALQSVFATVASS